ncbi:CpaD family pilus assembly lipoprotein [Alphaproteobacteria bacterium]|nr:CpaD family pilus assembly lipoprotein [Alphaproteobacteria bacterium]
MKVNILHPLKLVQASVLCLAFFTLAGCDLYEETWVTPNRLQVKEDRFFEKFPLTEMDEKGVRGLVKHYDRYGDGEIVLSVTYDPQSKTKGAMNASQEAARLVQFFKENYIKDVQAGILPDPQNPEMVLVSFTSYTAEAPEGCTTMGGVAVGSDIGKDKDYPLGCTIDTLFAKQISRPKDLKGQGSTRTSVDGRRITTKVELYRDGVQNEPLEGESASDQ